MRNRPSGSGGLRSVGVLPRVVVWAALGLLILAACVPPPPFDTGLTPVTAVPSPDMTDPQVLCAAVEMAWNTDWPAVIRALEVLLERQAVCPDGQPTGEKLYAAHYHYGQSLAVGGRTTEAIAEYQAALQVRSGGLEALRALRELGIFTPMPLPACTSEEMAAARAALPPYTPSSMTGFVGVQGTGFTLAGAEYRVRGVNYYPARYPWRRFLTETDLAEVQLELALLRDTGFNTLRLFLWHAALFTCPGSGAVPVPESFARLDAIIHAAAAQGFRLILTLNDLPDLTQYPLYTNPLHTQEQITFLVERYRDEAAILAWDLRDKGDLDYRSVREGGRIFDREVVLTWLAGTAEAVRGLDPHHLITAGWSQDAEATIPYVDFVSFHHWDDVIRLRARVAVLRSLTEKPILLEEFGYSTYYFDPAEQSRLLREAIQAADYDSLAGWLIWTAFDFPLDATCIPPACPSLDSPEHHFGLWQADYTPKVAASVVQVLVAQP